MNIKWKFTPQSAVKQELEITESEGEIIVKVKGAPAGHLFRLGSDGRIYLYNSVDPALGFPLDNKGRLIVCGEHGEKLDEEE